jgi:LacI family transcriptional regulator
MRQHILKAPGPSWMRDREVVRTWSSKRRSKSTALNLISDKAMPDQPSLQEITKATGLSRATVDRALHNRPGVHPRTRDVVAKAVAELAEGKARSTAPTPHASEPLKFRLVAQAGDAFTNSLVAESVRLSPSFEARGYILDVLSCTGVSDDDVAARLLSAGEVGDGVAVIGKNTQPIVDALRQLRRQGRAVVSVVSDIDPAARNCYVGIDNRAAGQAAGFLMGRHLQFHPAPSVAVVVASFSYRCHEDREIGFRSLLRQRFPHVNLVEVIKGADSAPATYDATKAFLEKWPTIAGVYNVAGGNQGLARALGEANLLGKALYITHELNEVTEKLIRTDAIDYLLSQNLETLLTSMGGWLSLICDGGHPNDLNFVPIELHCKYTI